MSLLVYLDSRVYFLYQKFKNFRIIRFSYAADKQKDNQTDKQTNSKTLHTPTADRDKVGVCYDYMQ